jgi:hypothetical protein
MAVRTDSFVPTEREPAHSVRQARFVARQRVARRRLIVPANSFASLFPFNFSYLST